MRLRSPLQVGPILEHEFGFCGDYPTDKPFRFFSGRARKLDHAAKPSSILPTSICTKTLTSTFYTTPHDFELPTTDTEILEKGYRINNEVRLKSNRITPTNLNSQQLIRILDKVHTINNEAFCQCHLCEWRFADWRYVQRRFAERSLPNRRKIDPPLKSSTNHNQFSVAALSYTKA